MMGLEKHIWNKKGKTQTGFKIGEINIAWKSQAMNEATSCQSGVQTQTIKVKLSSLNRN